MISASHAQLVFEHDPISLEESFESEEDVVTVGVVVRASTVSSSVD